MIFISYSRKDKEFVYPLVKLLRASGQNVFFDKDDIEFGVDWRENLENVIKNSVRFLLFWSKSTKGSEIVDEEIKIALNTPLLIIVPIILDKSPLPNGVSKYNGSDDLILLFHQVLAKKRNSKIILGIISGMILVFLTTGPIIFMQPRSNKDISYNMSENSNITPINHTAKISTIPDTLKGNEKVDTPKITIIPDTPKISTIPDTPKISPIPDTPKISPIPDNVIIKSIIDTFNSGQSAPKKVGFESNEPNDFNYLTIFLTIFFFMLVLYIWNKFRIIKKYKSISKSFLNDNKMI